MSGFLATRIAVAPLTACGAVVDGRGEGPTRRAPACRFLLARRRARAWRMVPLGVSTNAFTRLPLEEAVRRAAELGFSRVEVLADAPHAFPLPLAPERVAALRDALRETDVSVANVNANTASGHWRDAPPEPVFEPSLASPREAHRAWRVAFTRAAVDLAAEVGAPCVSVTTGRALVAPERAMGNLLRSLAEILPHAEARGVRVGIEYEPGLLVERADELLDLFDRVGSPWLGANLDVTHAWVNGEDPGAVARALGPRLLHVHAADARGRKHFHLPPGEGDVPWARVLADVAAANPHACVTLELYPFADAPDAAVVAGLKHLQASARLAEGGLLSR